MIGQKIYVALFVICFTTATAGASDLDEQLFKALYSKDYSKVKALIENKANVNAIGNFGWTPIMVAASKDQFESVALLIKHGADVNARNVGDVTPLMWSVNNRDISPSTIKIVRILIDNGADVNARTKKGRTALMWAKEFNHAEIVSILKAAGAKE